MFDFLAKIFDFIPKTVQSFAAFVPTQDNHRFNIVCDIIGVMCAACYSAFVIYGLTLAKLEGYPFIIELFDRLDMTWAALGVFAALCWLTTLFKK
ncbi:hypothetical protein ACK38U_01890 [Aeromonas veronii]|uniref:hypothetical protein n=1 Tax=Aeromonas veronii TaxID=654 RepID=UPI002B483D95|nr:hypothetical protein [Aeromonas veronii]